MEAAAFESGSYPRQILMEVLRVNPALRILKSIFSPHDPLPPHGELEHAHWDRETQTWRVHDELPEREAA
jgi:hypothetical protein